MPQSFTKQYQITFIKDTKRKIASRDPLDPPKPLTFLYLPYWALIGSQSWLMAPTNNSKGYLSPCYIRH